ncbi:MAG: TonB-dependent receptor [Candidatus Marinimicrobia bacterium]|nr:TonB-dependent receptor [Candidatus Neomarinimicrobiota bacterium]
MVSHPRHITVRLAVMISFSALVAHEDSNHELMTLDSLLNIQVSSALKYEQRVSEAPASISIITADDIQRYGYKTLCEVMMSVRGVYSRNDRNYEYLGIRGFSRPGDNDNRTLLLLNGQRLNENFYGSAFIGNDLGISLQSVERIEFVRGPASALYGTNAMFGVINIVTKKAQCVDGVNLEIETGSWGTQRMSAVIGKGTENGLGVLLSMQAGQSDGEDLYFPEFDSEDVNGIAEGLDWERFLNFHSVVTYKNWKMEGFFTNRLKGIPTAAWEMEFNNDAAQSLDRIGSLNLSYQQPIGYDKLLTALTYYNTYTYEGTYPYKDGDWWDVNYCMWAGAEGQFRWDISTRNRLFTGVEYQQHFSASYKSWDEDTTYFDDSFPYTITSLYLQDDYQITEKLGLITGVRFDKHSETKSTLTPRLGIIYNASCASTFKLLYGSAFRTPNVYEARYEDPDIAKGNPALKPEKITTGELVWEQKVSSVGFSVLSLYRYSMDNLIDQDIDPEDSLLQFINLSDIRAQGIEWGLRSNLKNGLSAYLNMNLQQSYDYETEEALSNTPEFILKAGVSFPLISKIIVYSEGVYETGRLSLYGTDTGAFFLCNAGLNVRHIWNGLSLSLRVRNLFDSEVKLPGSYDHEQDLIVQPGRYIGISINYSW